jgi:cytochrome P450
MSNANNAGISWDPYNAEIKYDPYPTFKRLRDEAPLYYNEEHDFYAVSRFADVERGLLDREIYSSARGDILECIKGGVEVPPGMFIWEDPPLHTMHRGVLARVFTPKRVNELEANIRDFCVRCLDPLVGAKGFDFIKDLGAEMPMRVIGWLLGIPEQDQSNFRDIVDNTLRTEAGKPMDVSGENAPYRGEGFEDYLDWRVNNPSDDLMTELLSAEFKDVKTGESRKLTRDEILVFCAMLAGAGNETTSRLIGWTAKTLSDHPDQRRELAKDLSLVPNAIEEILRFEPPGPMVARYVTRDVELYGKTVPAGNVMLFLISSANRDDRRFPDGDRFNIHRKDAPHITFGRGVHACIGSSLARMEGRVALEEVLKRFPDWTVDTSNAELSSTSTVRGWEMLPARIG